MWGLVYESIIQALRYYNAHHLTICASDELVEAIRKSSICNRVLDIIGPDGKNMLPLSCEERKELEALRAENVQIKQALRATNAWFYAEEHHESTTFHERMELCNYSEHLIENAAEEYCGVPHMVILPGLDVELVRADWQDAQEIVDRVLKEKEQPNDHE